MSPLSNSSASRLKPLALAVVLAFAGGASVANDATADRADAWSAPVTVRPDGSLLWPVTNCNDAGDGSLRDAAASARDGDGIDLSGLTCSLISLETGSITLNDVNLIGPGADQLEIDGTGNYPDRVFYHASSGGTLRIEGLTISGGKYISNASQGGACLRSVGGSVEIHDSVFDGCFAIAPTGTSSSPLGGAISAYGELGLYGTTVANSGARADLGYALGGGVFTQTNLHLVHSTITNNMVTSNSTDPFATAGGGVFSTGFGYIADSTIDGNTSEHGDGGGGVLQHNGFIKRSTISNNGASFGASGVAVWGIGSDPGKTTILGSSTISGNVSQASMPYQSGGLLINTPYAVIYNSTITNNIETNVDDARHGAGLVFGPDVAHYTNAILLKSTVVSGNFLYDEDTVTYQASDITGPFGAAIAGETILAGWSSLPLPLGTLVTDDPGLGPLQDNGGPTLTHLPNPDSPVVDLGSNPDALDYDQRGFTREYGDFPDIGSVELNLNDLAPDLIFASGFE